MPRERHFRGKMGVDQCMHSQDDPDSKLRTDEAEHMTPTFCSSHTCSCS